MRFAFEDLLAAILTGLLALPLCQPVLFKQTSATVDFLGGLVKFAAKSRIECGAQCFLKMSSHSCTAFALDNLLGMCLCGTKRLTPTPESAGSNKVLHINTDCNKNAKTGLYNLQCIQVNRISGST